MYLAAVLQMTSSDDPEANWSQAAGLIERAAGYGAKLVATPENTNFLGQPAAKVAASEPLDGLTCIRFAGLARRLGIHLLLGSFNESSGNRSKCRNTSVLFGPTGSILAVYRKIHLFDVELPGCEPYRESDVVEAGDCSVVAATEVGRLGLSICYDLRFGSIYRRMVRDGAEVLCVPAAFTLTTGRDHWMPLLKSRAIECQTYVLAPAQYGKHGDVGLGESYGHAMIVDPWGHVIAMASDGCGLALAEIDLRRVTQIRRTIPVREHCRDLD